MTSSDSSSARLPRSLSSSETWGFGLTGLLLWLGVAPAMQLELGWQALGVWLPGALLGILINLQVQRLGEQWTDLSGGTPSYLSRLLPNAQWLATYGALGYYISWVAVLPVNAIVLSDLVQANLTPFGIHCPTGILQIGFTAISFIVAFSGTRALGVLHLFFVVPAVSLLLLFCLQGMGWIAITSSVSKITWSEFHVGSWAKWYIVASYAVYACESGSAFVADSRYPRQTLRILPVAAALIPIVYLVGSWILLELGTADAAITTPYQQLLAASPFWGPGAAFVVTFLFASGSLLSCATAVSNTPRMLYQLSLDGQLPPVFAQISRQGILGVGLVLTLILSMAFLLWGDIAQIVFVTGLGWLSSFVIFHWGLWRQRHQSYIRWARWSLGFALVEALIVIVGGFAWNWQDLLLGLCLPIATWLIFQLIGRLPWPQLGGYDDSSRVISRVAKPEQDWAFVQIAGLIGLIGGAMIVSWFIHAQLAALPPTNQINVLVVVLLIGAALGVAIAGWTTLPQIAAIGEAREQAEQFFNMAADGIVVLAADGHILQANQASQALFGTVNGALGGQSLYQLLPDLLPTAASTRPPVNVPLKATFDHHALEVTLSTSSADLEDDHPAPTGQLVAIIRDISERQAAENALRQKATELQELLHQLTQTQSQLVQAEKMSGLGQLMAGVAHEINNPLSFIAGNVKFARDYALDLLEIVEAYQTTYPSPPPALAQTLEDLELDFLCEDFPKLLDSMKDGANRILNIVQSLKTFSRHDESPTKEVNLYDGIDSTLVILRNRLKASGHLPEIQVVRQFDPLPLVECYPSMLNQVFMNLLVNAIDALEMVDYDNSSATPTITLSACAKSQGDRPGVEISFADNGPGIPEDKRDRLCDPFFTTKPIGKGTGLGLSISYQIVVERHGGMFVIESKPDQGAKFTIWLPLTLTPGSAKDRPLANQPQPAALN
ncbi:PAS domain-containing sensor histidine kinase [filamentous cyanobacterium CCP5]|nr:PAS domain-containing sensor histidine kinase [filamentous cyanobacterium CCP5]